MISREEIKKRVENLFNEEKFPKIKVEVIDKIVNLFLETEDITLMEKTFIIQDLMEITKTITIHKKHKHTIVKNIFMLLVSITVDDEKQKKQLLEWLDMFGDSVIANLYALAKHYNIFKTNWREKMNTCCSKE
jgi:hypothetical protein